MSAGSSLNTGIAATPAATLAAAAPDALKTSAEDISIVCHENEIPAFAEAALERIYGTLFSSLAHFSVYGGAEQASTCVIRTGDKLTDVLLFRREQRSVRVINEWIRLGDEDIRRFARYIFDRYPEVDRIEFHAVELDIERERLPFPGQRFNCTDDTVVMLPGSADAYLAQLGKATRKNIRRYLAKLKDDFPDFRYQVYETDQIDEQHVRAIIGLNRQRMANKNKVSGIDEREAERMLRLLKVKGVIGVATIGGKVCAGALTYRIGDNYFSYVRSHDPQYDDHRLGLVGGYLLIAECIGRGGKEFHFMWGREQHKLLLLGVQKDLDHLTVYRSRSRLLLDGRSVLKNALDLRMRELKRRLLTTQDNDSLPWRLAAAGVRRLRRTHGAGH